MIALLAFYCVPGVSQILRVDSDLIINPSAEWNETLTLIRVQPADRLSDWRQVDGSLDLQLNGVRAPELSGLAINVQDEDDDIALVELTWTNPKFEFNELVLPQGRCTGAHWRLPRGEWRVLGQLRYDRSLNSLHWLEFSFINNPGGAAEYGLGQCQLPPQEMEELNNYLARQANDPLMMTDLLQKSILAWSSTRVVTAKERLLEPTQTKFNERTSVTWRPLQMETTPAGRWRVKSRFEFHVNSRFPIDFGLVPRTALDSDLSVIEESALILPIDAIERIVSAVSYHSGFNSELSASDLNPFQQLFESRWRQLWEWADLRNWPLNPPLKFNVSAYAQAMLYGPKVPEEKKGVEYNFKAPVQVQTLGLVNNTYWPYWDFHAIETGALRTWVNDGEMRFQMTFDQIHLRSYPRDEFLHVRPVEKFVHMDALNTRFGETLQNKEFSFGLPRWALVHGLELRAVDFQLQDRRLQLPLKILPVGN